jgi:hypothetical protein
MKKPLLLLSFIISAFVNTQAQELWDNFDTQGKATYIFSDGILDRNFNNPQTTGINSSAKCASYTRNNAVQNDVIVIDPAGTRTIGDVSSYLTNTKKMSMKIYTSAPVGTTVQITLENKAAAVGAYPLGRHSEYTAVTTVANQWQLIEFTFNSQPDNTISNTSVDRLVILFNPNSSTNHTYLFDDLMGVELIDPCTGVAVDNKIIEDFECQRNLPYLFTNGTLITADNPLTAGINTTQKCGRFTKYVPPTNDGAFGGDLNQPFTTATFDVAKIQLYSTAADQRFYVIFQDGSTPPTTLIEHIIQTQSTTEWQEYYVDLSSISTSATIAKVVLLLNPTTTTEDVIYLDNFTLQKGMGINSKVSSDINTAVFPNPSAGLFKIQSNESIASVRVTDNIGRQITAQQYLNLNNAEIDMTAVDKGFYNIMVGYSSGKISSHRIVKF